MTDLLDGGPDHRAVRPVPKPPFLPSDRFAIRRIGRPDLSGLTVYIFRDVAEELLFAARFHPALTTAGFLTGGYFVGPAGRYVEVRGFRDSSTVDSVRDFARGLEPEWHRLQREAELADKGLVPLGWFVSRPDCGGKPGPWELITHLTYFNLPHHVCMILDPIQQVLGVYRQIREGRIENIGFNLIQTAKRHEEHRHEDR